MSKNRLLLHLEGEDSGLLDKETYKLYLRLVETGAKVGGPIPLPFRSEQRPPGIAGTLRIHRRLFRISSPTEKTMSLLEQLALSGVLRALVEVEEENHERPA